jgi:NADPH-ferrihemoprotein reductase
MKDLETANKMILFFGSQTGTAEDLASRVAKDVTASFGVQTLVCDLEEYDMTELSQFPDKDSLGGSKWLVGFFLATYGEGEPTDNAIEFYEWLMNGGGKGDDEGDQEDEMVDDQVARNVDYIMFGLGNKTYEHFNSMGRRSHKRLKALGGTLVGPAGEGDDDGR